MCEVYDLTTTQGNDNTIKKMIKQALDNIAAKNGISPIRFTGDRPPCKFAHVVSAPLPAVISKATCPLLDLLPNVVFIFPSPPDNLHIFCHIQRPSQ